MDLTPPDRRAQLLEVGADPKVSTEDGATPIVMAAQGVLGKPEIQEGGGAKCVQYLLDAGATQTERDEVVGTVPLHVAIYSGRPGVVEVLLAGPNAAIAANTKDSKGATPLIVACRQDTIVAAKVLLQAPVNVEINVQDENGRTPLIEATLHGHHELVKVRYGTVSRVFIGLCLVAFAVSNIVVYVSGALPMVTLISYRGYRAC